MDKKSALFILAGLGAAAYGIVTNWEAISLKLGLDDLYPGRIRAIDLVKKAYSFDSTRTNWEILADRVHGEIIRIQDDPWTADPIDESWYRVTYDYREDGDPRHHRFRVNVNTMAVAMDRDEYERSYHKGPATPPPAPR